MGAIVNSSLMYSGAFEQICVPIGINYAYGHMKTNILRTLKRKVVCGLKSYVIKV